MRRAADASPHSDALTLRQVCRAGFCRPRHAVGLVNRAARSLSPPTRDRVSGRRPRRRRSVSRILSSRPGSESSSHSSGPPVARGIERPTRGNGRAARAWPRGQTSLLHGLAPGGVYRASALSSGPGELLPHRFTVAPRPKARGCLLSVALSPDRSGPPLAATMPCGVRTFLPPREAASDCSTSSGGNAS